VYIPQPASAAAIPPAKDVLDSLIGEVLATLCGQLDLTSPASQRVGPDPWALNT
jgi:hypothetical protein